MSFTDADVRILGPHLVALANFRSCDLAGGSMSVGSGFELSKPNAFPILHRSFLFAVQDLYSWLLALATMLSFHDRFLHILLDPEAK